MSPLLIASALGDHSAPGNGAVARIALLGSGTVGQAVLTRLGQWRGGPIGDRLSLVYAANTRASIGNCDGLDPGVASRLLAAAPAAPRRDPGQEAISALGSGGIRILIDATADAATAARHADCLAAGIHVATACKLAAGTSLDRWQAIQHACLHNATGFGDRATVGAGLPLLRSIRELQAGGDRIHAIAGVMSGSLAWLFDRFDGSRPFSALVREALAAGFTEPDPREDLSGEDVRRKLLILARAAGFPLAAEAVEVGSLVPPPLAALDRKAALAALDQLDGPLAERHAEAVASGRQLRFIARLEGGKGRVGLEALDPADPLSGGSGTDNRVAIWSDRYARQPLVIQGPGAGAEVTAAALLDDVLQLRALAIGHRRG